MTSTPTQPPWAVPGRAEISDLHWLAYANVLEGRDPLPRGIVAALEWVRGERDGPLTGRSEQPVTAALARAEMWAAAEIVHPDAPVPTRTLVDELGVAYRRPLPIAPHAAEGVRLTLRWLLGDIDASPLDLPARCTDGNLAEVHVLVQAAMTAAPHRSWGPEERHAARAEAQATVERSRRLLDRIAEIQAQVTSA
ncbi:hypothetical protein [Pseudonocardia parietis]|uniref:Golgi phosphoprotein 3 GPP34 n=1 Tax=Pseudonocardia parietis TaxID=570936 RepID=A0ABS4W1T3_9PSEU|nr:hypothetical protein [Pseudonocardia parietis]MBP2369908.1 hypothetical protein [Pseudonocardia parietis]